MNKEIAKAKATALRTYMDSLGIKINHSHALEAVARMEGETCYNTLQAKFVDTPCLAPSKSVLALSPSASSGLDRDYPALDQEYAALAREVLKLREDGFLPGELDPRAGVLWTYQQGRLAVSLSYQSGSFLDVRVHEVDANGVEVGDAVSCACLPLRVTSGVEERREFVRFLGEALGHADFASLSVSGMREGIEALCAGQTNHAAIFGRLRYKAQAKSSPAKSWDIDVCRKEMADVTVIVRNATRAEAENEAIGEASSRSLDAHEVDYLLADDDLHADDPKVVVPPGLQEWGDWEITVRRVSAAFARVIVEGASDQETAEMIAVEEANEHDFANTSEWHVIKSIMPL